MKEKILVVAAHPDDEILGCGGTIARLIKEGCVAFTLLLGEGITSRDKSRDPDKRREGIAELKEEAKKANRILGVEKVFHCGFPDNRFDTVPFLDVVKEIEGIKKEVRPRVIFTHYEKDLNIDHRITYKAAITAARPLPGEAVREIYSFEVPSSTEFNYPLSFSPDIFIDISGSIGIKQKALKEYKTEMMKYPHPRSPEGLELNAKLWGMKTGIRYAEAFKAVRILK